MNIALIVAIIEIISILVKKFWPNGAKFLPLVNSVIGVVGSLITGTDWLAGLATAGITCMGYDFFHELYDLFKTKKLEAKKENE